ncbi:MAG: PaaI family thioesterase [Burkholderiaceae bacterium]
MPNSDSDTTPLLLQWQQYTTASPFSRELGMEVRSAQADACVIGVPYRNSLVGNPATGVLHSGVITTLLDSCSGLAIFVRLNRVRAMATLDLRIDHLKPATPGREVLGNAHCYKLTSELAFVRGSAYHDTPDDPIATSVAIFMFTGTPAFAMGTPTR